MPLTGAGPAAVAPYDSAQRVLAVHRGSGGGGRAQTPEQFYKGKNIDMIVGYPPGGSNDVFARFLVRACRKFPAARRLL